MDIKKEKEFLCGFKLRERMKGKKIPGAGFLNGAAEPPRHCRGKGGETVEGSSAVALILPPLSLLSACQRSLLSIVLLNLFCEEVGTRASHMLIMLVFWLIVESLGSVRYFSHFLKS